MSLVAAGESAHPVVERGVAFLERSVRADGRWPIDTNLATWVTTLAVNALARRSDRRDPLEPTARTALGRWLLDQQYRERHVYTDAPPGGWAWTDLPGGVPDADDTPGALLALHVLGADDSEYREAACAGIGWLLGLQNADGGVPTFCRGWGALPFDRSSPDLTAHTLRAWTAWRPMLPSALGTRTDRATGRAVRYLERAQQADGSWITAFTVYAIRQSFAAGQMRARSSTGIERRASNPLQTSRGPVAGLGSEVTSQAIRALWHANCYSRTDRARTEHGLSARDARLTHDTGTVRLNRKRVFCTRSTATRT